ncbi:beta-hexosaminidase subunit beta [Elysia marginata]|uniref:Beta-hexosaminidase subunit beta n=1 Tax=Elysia marginata TaxID=1093978 RepID=A0AAV4JZ04_9GAST|nr:beta-hexosaminidase subunit beta [Elysia marginata]
MLDKSLPSFKDIAIKTHRDRTLTLMQVYDWVLNGRPAKTEEHFRAFATRKKLFVVSAAFRYSIPKDSNYVDTPTVGQPWPMPVRYDTKAETVSVDAKNFQFKSIGVHCDILEAAYTRYKGLTFGGYRVVKPYPRVKGNLKTLDVFVKNSCSGKIYPSLNSSESYQLTVSSSHARLDADEVWGALRGLETFSQIVYRKESGEVWSY